ncbi:MAG TPA: autotransporter outer membrane beta-barrel domain-containing protein [Sphingomicrobium sp.]|nr:autotransporter outer membrane beta-barrel domain-containing protein [Sphingomicrobium sp.]
MAAAALATPAFANSGKFSVKAVANPTAPAGAALATARGYDAGQAPLGSLGLDVLNEGTMTVSAVATAANTAGAAALGIAASASGVAGNVINSGTLNVRASAAGTLTSATATGIGITAGTTDLTITNSGALNVDAVVSSGGTANATGIGATAPVPPEGAARLQAAANGLTINNSGDLIVRVSTDGGLTFQRGTAIDVSAAPAGGSVVNLLGGNVSGNVALQSDDDVVNMSGGTFDGIVNPACMPEGGVVPDDPVQNGCGVGTLNISGNPQLASNGANGPSTVFVDTLNVAPDGTLNLALPAAAGGTAPAATYPQLIADTANLDGTLVATLTSPNGLFDDSVFQNVIDAQTLNGTFDQCVINGVSQDPLLLSLGCTYDDQGNLDLALSREPFNTVPGLTENGSSVAGALEGAFAADLTGGLADLFSDLFLFTDADNFQTALHMLSGSVYANYLNSLASFGVHRNDLVDRATDCDVPALVHSLFECRKDPIHVWGQLDHQTRKVDGDIEAGPTRSKRFVGLVGVDARVGDSTLVGIDAGYLSDHLRDRRFGDKVEGNGWTIGAYGVYDPGSFFVEGMASYNSLNGKSRRQIDFAGLAPDADFVAAPTGSPDAKIWTLGLHGGARFPISPNSILTPYLDLDFAHVSLSGFVERGASGAELRVSGEKASHAFMTGGVKWAGQFGAVVPEVNLGYRYRFGNERETITESFLCPTAACAFNVVSASEKRGTFLGGVSIGGRLGRADLRIGYEGEFNGRVTSHSGSVRIVVPLGGR